MQTAIIQSWNQDLQTTEPVKISMASKIRLGIEDQPIVYVYRWAEDQNIKTIREMADYIEDLDFNVEVIK